ncbi:MAG TPA: restriction endonuclease subunit S [Bryobacteraceae bacterium]|jgi:type I restriction enzyme S subunit|nr:restriction endonuclease subunit S [Bryobacteraceae bacterium]
MTALRQKTSPIGPIGDDWALVELDKVAEPPQYGLTASAEKTGNAQLVRITDIDGRNVNWASVPYCNCPTEDLPKYRLESGDILFARIGATTGKSTLVVDPPNAVFASYLIRVRAKQEVDPEFLSHFFQSQAYWLQIDGSKHTNLKKGVNGSVLRRLLVPTPPLAEQRQITRLLSAVQRAVERQKRLITLTVELKKALMLRLFSNQALSSHPVRRLGTFCDIRGGKRLPKGESFATEKTDHPYIRVTDLANHAVDIEGLKYLRPETRRAISRYIITKHDVYISIAGTTGAVGMVPEQLDGANLTENAARIVINDTTLIEPRYLMFFLASHEGQHYLKSQTMKNAQPKLALTRIKSLEVPVPPLEKQRNIAKCLDTVIAREDAAFRTKQQLDMLFRTLLHELMTAQVRVHILDLSALDELATTAVGPS